MASADVFVDVNMNGKAITNTSLTLGANLDANSHKIVNLTNGASAQDAAAFGQIPTSFPPSGSAGGVLDGSYPNPGLAAAVAGAGLAETSDVLSVNVDNSTIAITTDTLGVKALGITDAQVAAANKDGAAGTVSMRTLGTAATAACAGNDSRLSDSRAPNGSASGDLTGSYPGPSVATGILGGAPWTTIRRGADLGRNTTTTPTIDPVLQFTATSGVAYEVEAFIAYVSTAGGTTPDIKASFGEDTSTRGSLFWWGIGQTDTATSAVILTSTSATGTLGTQTTNRVFHAYGSHVGAGGTFGFFWSQNTSGGNDTTVKAQSVLRYRAMT